MKSSWTSLTAAAAWAFSMLCASAALAAVRLSLSSFSALPSVIAAIFDACATFALLSSTNCSVALYIVALANEFWGCGFACRPSVDHDDRFARLSREAATRPRI